MEDNIKRLSRLIYLKKENRDLPYVLILGAGASLNSGASSMRQIIRMIAGEDNYDKFCSELDNYSRDERFNLLKKHLIGEENRVVKASLGYRCIADLIKEGYFDVIFTTNFDTFLEDTLADVGERRRDFMTLIVGQHKEDEIVEQLNRPNPKVKIVKLHGDLFSRNFAFTEEEIFQFKTEIEETLISFLRWRDVIILGHSMRDFDLNRCFEIRGGSIWFVNPDPNSPTGVIKTAMSVRGGHKITGDLDGDFDYFCCELKWQIEGLKPDKIPPKPYNYKEPVSNPRMFFGRKQGLKDIYKLILWKEDQEDDPKNCLIIGPGQIGRSSMLSYIYRRQKESFKWQDYIFVLLDIQELDSITPQNLFSALLARIQDESDGKISLDSRLSSGDWLYFRRCLKEWSEQYNFIIMLDNFDEIVENSDFDPVLERMSALSGEPEYRISYIITSQTTSAELGRSFKEIYIGLFEDEEAEQLIREPHGDKNLTILNDEVQWILELAGPHPLYLQMLCHGVFDTKSSGNPLNNAERERICTWFQGEANPCYQKMWNQLSKSEREGLIKLVCGYDLDNEMKENLYDKALLNNKRHIYSKCFAKFVYERREEFSEYSGEKLDSQYIINAGN